MEQQFGLTSSVTDGVLVIATNGYINNVGGEAISKEFNSHFAGGLNNVVIDLSGSKVVNSIGMSFLIEILEQLQESGGQMIFTGLDPAVEKMLAIMGIFTMAGKQPDVESAIRTLNA
jgi:anti-anti-sigma factor